MYNLASLDTAVRACACTSSRLIKQTTTGLSFSASSDLNFRATSDCAYDVTFQNKERKVAFGLRTRSDFINCLGVKFTLKMNPVTRKVNVKTRGGSVVSVFAREHYLRTDVPCRSQLCFEGCDNGKHPVLPRDVTHYLLPLEDVVRSFLDVLEFPELGGIVFLQSVVSAVQQSSMRHYRRVCRIVKDEDKSSKTSVFFPNEFNEATHVERSGEETMREWKTRNEDGIRKSSFYYLFCKRRKFCNMSHILAGITLFRRLLQHLPSPEMWVHLVSLDKGLHKRDTFLQKNAGVPVGIQTRAALTAV